MPDTRRTLAALQALLADNNAGDISAQDVRDLLLSVWGGPALLDKKVATGSEASLDFTGKISADYDAYLWHFQNVRPVTNTQDFRTQFSTDGGSTWLSTNNYYWEWAYYNNSAGSGIVNGNPTGYATIFTNISNAFTSGVSGTFQMFDPLTSNEKVALIDVFARQASTVYRNVGSAYWSLNAAVNAVKFYFASGNVASGSTIRMYGWPAA